MANQSTAAHRDLPDMGFKDSMRKAVEELQQDNLQPAPRSSSAQQGVAAFDQEEGYDAREPPKDEMQEYWRAFETVPFVRQSITSFSRETIEPGWWLEADNDNTAERLAEWLREAAIVEGEKGQDFAVLLKKVITQREVRGTTLIEHVPDEDNDETIAALKLINPETVTTMTQDNQNILLEPDDEMPSQLASELEEAGETTDETPAYVQFYGDRFVNRDPVPFTINQITKLTRDADVGELYGTSRLESVLGRIEALNQKLNDKDIAIRNKAWPIWVFKFGPDDDPWHPDDVDNFMEEESEGNFTPGTKHGVQGDVDIQTVGGDVPEISESIQYDVNHIISGLPMPKFATGFAEEINQFVSKQQENRIRRQVRESRRELEYEFQNILELKAEELGLDTSGLSLHIEQPDGEDPLSVYEQSGSTIRYVSDSDGPDENATPVNQYSPGYEPDESDQESGQGEEDSSGNANSEEGENDSDTSQ